MDLPRSPILPEQIWNILTAVQQRILSQTIVQVCQRLMKTDKVKSAMADRRMGHEQS